MTNPRVAGKVGFFVAIGAIALVLLLLSFSKGLSPFTPTYQLRLRATSVAGLKPRALVLVSGVPVGHVVGADVAAKGRGVIIGLRIRQRYKLHADARFVIEQIGFLGDQYVAVYPQSNAGAILKDGDEVPCEEPFNLQEIVRSTTGLIQRVNNTLKVLSDAFQRADRTVFSEQSLSNLTVAISNFRQVSDRTLNVMENVQRLVQTNTPSVSISVSNLARFSQDLDKLAAEIHATFASNRVELSSAVKNMESAARVLSGLAEDVEAGKGVAGSLFKDEALQAQLRETFANLATLSSNLTRYGLLYKPKQPKREAGSKGPVSLGRNPTK